MKRIIFAGFFLLLTASYNLKAQGIVFETGTFSEVLEKAKQQDKLIFVDFYTDWCGPCKHMTTEVFTKERVGRLFNENFINYKIDAEKGEGPELKNKYGVNAYPTMLFLNSDGTAVHRMVGARDEQKLIDDASGLEQAAQYGGMERMKADFENGRQDVQFLIDFYNFLPEKDNLRTTVAERYLLNVPEEKFISETDTDMDLNDKMIRQTKAFNPDIFYRLMDIVEKKREASEDGKYSAGYNIGVMFGIEWHMHQFIRNAIRNGDEKGLEDIIRFQQAFRKAAGRRLTGDGDAYVFSGRELFFASPEFLRLRFLSVNGNDPARFNTEIVSYMENLMSDFPVEAVWEKHGITPGNNSRFAFGSQRKSDIAMDYIIGWAKYYWRLNPSNKKTKETVARWLNYACAINPLNSTTVINAVPLLVKTGHSKDAIRNLERTLEFYESAPASMNQGTDGIEEMIEDINNGKI